MAHITVEKAESILDKEYKVLDYGFVRLVDYYGDDSRIVQTARVSYGKGTKSLREDKALIDYLLRNDHSSPFEHVVFTFHCKMPIFVARQWIRHRTARVNEISGRYSVLKTEFYKPSRDKIAKQSKNNKQGREQSAIDINEADKVLNLLEETYSKSAEVYDKLLDMGIARELARIVLPLSTYTEWYWQMDLKNLMHFLKLRLDTHAQYEIRVYAEKIAEIIKHIVPYTWEAFENHILRSTKISYEQQKIVKNIINGASVDKENRQFKKLEEKLSRI